MAARKAKCHTTARPCSHDDNDLSIAEYRQNDPLVYSVHGPVNECIGQYDTKATFMVLVHSPMILATDQQDQYAYMDTIGR